jgi:formate hydrogenlyase subunit 3/multisubunit Na+/H+ antiporter MnhD subunit
LSLIELTLLFVLVASLLHVTRSWARLACGVILLSTAALLLDVKQASTQPLDILGVSLTLEAVPRDFLLVGLVLTCALALATITRRDRTSLSFLYWSWIPWFIALMVNDFVVAVIAWAIGFVVEVFGMKPRKFHRASGAAYFLVVVVIATSSLLLANRFVGLYPLTPERTVLIQFAFLFLSLGYGMAFALFPFQFWVGPMTDDSPLPTAAAVLALGQPIGLLLLFRFLNQNVWLTEKSNLFELMALGGLVASIVGGLMAAVERRAGRLLGYAAVFTFGFALLDLSRATQEGLAYSGLEILSRAIGLTVLACAATIGREVEDLAVRRIAQTAVLLAGFSLVGLRLGVGLSERWNALLQIAGSDQRLFAILILAHMGLLVGVVRFTSRWLGAEVAEERDQLEIAAAAKTEPVYEPAGVPILRGESESGSARNVVSGNGGRSGAETAAAGAVTLEPPARESAVAVMAGGGNGTGDDGEGEGEKPSAPEEYVFEEHLREIAKRIIARARPHVRHLARSLPSGTVGLIGLLWTTWRVWVSIALLLALVGVLLLVGFVPGALFDRVVASLGRPPIVQ